MATREVTLSAAAWVLVSTATTGTMENQTGHLVHYRTAAQVPAPAVMGGHLLERGESKSWAFDPAQNIYARFAGDGSGALTVTEG